MEKNPFKFGSVVSDPYFTDRTVEIEQVTGVLNSSNHLILISPRRFGKSSLILKVVSGLNRPIITLDLQLVTSVEDFAALLLKRVYRAYPYEKVRQFVKHFRIIPAISLNPVNNEVDISFQPSSNYFPILEDVLNLIEKLGREEKKTIVVFDEFQEVVTIDRNLSRQMRSVMQHHKNINYVFLGSQESLIRNIFEKKKSSFYHFGILLSLGKIPHPEFAAFLFERFRRIGVRDSTLTEEILAFTDCHPYYTQQLAFSVWELLYQKVPPAETMKQAIQSLISTHDMDFERIWNRFNKTDKKLLIGLSQSSLTPLSEAFYRKFNIGSPSTVFSCLKRLSGYGYIVRQGNRYGLDDPYFRQWILERREQ